MKVRGDDTLEGAHSFAQFLRQIFRLRGFWGKSPPFRAIKVRGDDTLEGASSFAQFLGQIFCLRGFWCKSPPFRPKHVLYTG